MSDAGPDPRWTVGEPALVEFFEVITRVEAPDLWERIERQYAADRAAAIEADSAAAGDISPGDADEVVLLTSVLSPGFGVGRGGDDDETNVFSGGVVRPGVGDRLGRRGRWLAFVGLVVVVGLGWIGLAATGEEPVDLDGDSNLDADTSNGTGIAGDRDLDDTTAVADGLPISSTGCDVQPGPSSQNVTFDVEQTESPAQLIEQAPLVVRGDIILAESIGDGGVITIRLAGLAGPERLDRDPFSTLRIPFAPRDDWVGASFVAVLNGMDVPNREFPDQVAGLVHPEGLWLSCGSDIPAVSAIFTPHGDEWDRYLAQGPTLDELWGEALYPGGGVTDSLGRPTATDRGADVYDLRLLDGGRLRLALPPSLQGDYIVTQGPPPAPVSLTNGPATISIDFGRCSRNLWEANLLGSDIAMDVERPLEGSRVLACRPDQQIRTTITSSSELTDADRDLVDVRTITVGSAQRESLVGAGLDQSSCLDCPDTTPIRFADSDVVIAPADRFRVAAISPGRLAEVWVFESEAPYTDLLAGDDHLFVAFDDGRVVRLAAVDGSVTWASAFDEGERDVSLSFGPDSSLLVRSSFAVPVGEDDEPPGQAADQRAEQAEPKPPVLRRVDRETGQVLWRADGRPGTVWQLSAPQLVDDAVVVIDVNDAVVRNPIGGIPSTFDPTAAALGFDINTGALRWTTDLRSRLAIRDRDLVALFEFQTGRVLLARTVDGDVFRLDLDDGSIIWQAAVPAGRFNGTEFADDGTLGVGLTTPVGPVLLNPVTGEMLPQTEPDEFVCPVTTPPVSPFLPPDPWPTEPSALDGAWFGTDELWTVVSIGDHARQKNLYWSADYGGVSAEPSPELSLRFVRLDPVSGDAGSPLVIDIPAPGTSGSVEGQGEFMVNDIQPEQPGCWQVTASYRSAELTHVYELR